MDEVVELKNALLAERVASRAASVTDESPPGTEVPANASMVGPKDAEFGRYISQFRDGKLVRHSVFRYKTKESVHASAHKFGGAGVLVVKKNGKWIIA